MILYYIKNYTSLDESDLKGHGAFYSKNEKAYIVSEYTPNLSYFQKWDMEEHKSDAKVSLTILSKCVNLNMRAVQAFLVKQNMLTKEGNSLVLTERAKENGAEYITRYLHGENATYAVYGDSWARYLNKYRSYIEQITETKQKQKQKQKQNSEYRTTSTTKKVSIPIFEGATYEKFKKVGIPDNAVFLDTETTGLSEYDEVIELGIVDIEGNTLYNGLFKPYRPNSPSAEAVNHISAEMLKDAPDFADEFMKIQDVLKGRVIVGHNVNFDIRLLTQTARIHNADTFVFEHCNTIDTMDVTKCFMQVKKYKLEMLCQMLGKSESESHRAIDDALWTLWLVEQFERRPFLPL